jgi:hypothetical protein
MKRLILIVITLLITMVAQGQTFAGIPLSGNVDVFRQKLTPKGFILKKVITGGYVYKGKIGLDEVNVYVMHTQKNRYVTKVAVFFNERYSFERLKEDYEEKLAVLVSKYGEANECFDFFLSPFFEGDGYEMAAIRADNYRRMCFWTEGVNALFPKTIKVVSNACIMILYENSENLDILEKEQQEQIKNGL